MIAIGIYRPSTWRKNDLSPHAGEDVANRQRGRKVVGTDREAQGAQLRLHDAESIANGIEIVSDVQLVDLAVMQQNIARRTE